MDVDTRKHESDDNIWSTAQAIYVVVVIVTCCPRDGAAVKRKRRKRRWCPAGG